CSNSFQDCRSVIVASVVISHLEETVHQIARLVAVVVRGIPFYNVERAEHQEPSGWPRIEMKVASKKEHSDKMWKISRTSMKWIAALHPLVCSSTRCRPPPPFITQWDGKS